MRLAVRLLCAAVLLCSSAPASVLTFDITDLYGNALTNYTTLPPDYGDRVTSASSSTSTHRFTYEPGDGWTPHITVDYVTLTTATGQVFENTVDAYRKNYGDLYKLAIPGGNNLYVAEITLRADPGWLVELSSFDLGTWYSTSMTTPVTVAGVQSTVTLPASSHYHFAAAQPIAAPSIAIRFGENSYNVGIDNIRFTERLAPVGPDPISTPEPATLLLIGIGLTCMGTLYRKTN